MAHISEEELQAKLAEAAKLLEIGSIYAHYKHPEQHYEVVGFGIIEATDEVGVLYKWLYGGGFTFIRPLSSFLDHVEWEGHTVPRFTKVT
jgi:hypothetical protein